jgi:ABC-type nickel/cobalt efflux system permease component RcnA
MLVRKFKAISVALVICFGFWSTVAEARSHRHHHASHYHYTRQAEPVFSFGGFFSFDTPALKRHAARSYSRKASYSGEVTVSDNRPSDCYGIAWCGCYLRHYFGLSDRNLNRAIMWAGVGRSTYPHAGAIVVWHHHVGVMKSDPDARGVATVLSGNDGRGVRERPRSIREAVAFREL